MLAALPSIIMQPLPLITFFLPNLSAGGAERVLMAISGEIATRGYRCDLVTARSDGQWTSAVSANIRHVSLESAKPLYSVPKLIRYIRRERPIAMLSSVFSANLAALMACHMSLLPVRCIIREAYRAGEEIKASSALTTLGNTIALRVLYRRADAVITLSSALAKHILEVAHIPRNKICVIPNPVLPYTEEQAHQIEKCDIASLIVACGRLEPQKDFATLLRAFAIVRTHRTVKLAILGEGSQSEKLRSLSMELGIEGDVCFIGHASKPHQWMRRAGVFVSTSRCEGFPNVLLEALDSGCQIVSTNSSDSVSEILDGGRLGAIVAVGDELNIAKLIEEILDGVRVYPSPCTHLRSYDLATITSRYLDVILGETSI